MRTSASIFVILVVAVSMLCVSCELFFEKHHPKDSELIENFYEHQADFETLVQMLKEDRSLGRVAYDFTRVSNFFGDCKEEAPDCSTANEIGVTEARLTEY